MIKKIKHEIKKYSSEGKTDKAEVIINNFKNRILDSYKNKISGIYLIGSYALNDFSQELSDIDFVVTLNYELNNSEILSLEILHKEIEVEVIQPNLNGIYIKESSIGKAASEIETLVEFHAGELSVLTKKSRYYAINPITWAELENFGIAIFGKKREELKLKTNWEDVDFYMNKNLNSYWNEWLQKSKNIFHIYYYLTLFRRKENAWCICGVARQLYSLKESKITSKKRACEYRLGKMPSKFNNILKDAINYRIGKKSRVAWKQKKETLEFLDYCINEFNSSYEKKYGS